MKGRRPCFSFFLCCLFTFGLATEVFGNRHPFARHNIDSKWRRDHDRRLSSVYDVEECQWIQDASCQINPTYARHLLSDGSSRSSQEVQDAILGEAECLTMTHEATCISDRCKWVVLEAIDSGNEQSLCQFSVKHQNMKKDPFWLVGDAAYVMYCKKQLDGSCIEDRCQSIRLSENEAGCGIDGRRALDLVMSTSTSQTEVVASLVEVEHVSDLRNEAKGILSSDKKNGRRLFQSNGVLAVDDEYGNGNSSTTQRSDIKGTGNDDAFEEQIEAKTTSRVQNRYSLLIKRSGGEATSPEIQAEATPSTSQPSEKPYAGSFSFEISGDEITDTAEPPDDSDDPTTSPETRIETSLRIDGPIAHLEQVDISIPVKLNQIIDVLELLTMALEKALVGKSIEKELKIAAAALEIMRFRLDSRMDFETAESTWEDSDAIWTIFQKTTQSLDAWTEPGTVSNGSENGHAAQLLSALERARRAFSSKADSEKATTLASLEKRLVVFESKKEPSEPPKISRPTLDGLVFVVVESFTQSLQKFEPEPLDPDFASKYQQTWVRLYIERNLKWIAIRDVIRSESALGENVVQLIRRLYNTQAPSDGSVIPNLSPLKELVDQMTGIIIATHSDRYKVENLPQSLKSPGIQIWEEGPKITVSVLDTVQKQTTKNLETSRYAGYEGFLSVSDEVLLLLESMVILIDAKSAYLKKSSGIPEETAILLILEAAMNMITDWNNFTSINNTDVSNKIDNPFGHPDVMDYVLSLVGCGTLARKEGKCQALDITSCVETGLYDFDNTKGVFLENYIKICAPDTTAEIFQHLFADVPLNSLQRLKNFTTDLYLVSAYCPNLNVESCKADGRCDLYYTNHEIVCRPASNFINFVIETSHMIELAATTKECEAYLGLPVCSNFRSASVCPKDGCLWIERSWSETNSTEDICVTDWMAQLRATNPKTFKYDKLLEGNDRMCREKNTEQSCTIRNYEYQRTNQPVSQLPSQKETMPKWVAYTLSAVVAIGFAAMAATVWKLVRKTKSMTPKKKGKGKRKGEATGPQRGAPVPMYTLPYSTASGSSSGKRDDFDFVKEAFEDQTFVITGPSSRIATSIGSSQIERHTSGTTTISEIQPVSEIESSSDSEDSGQEGWTTSSQDFTDEDDQASLPELSP